MEVLTGTVDEIANLPWIRKKELQQPLRVTKTGYILTEFANDDCRVARSHRALPRRNLLITDRLASRDHVLQMSAAQRVGNLFV